MQLPGPVSQSVYHWRRVVIALWLSAAAHAAILAFIRVGPATAPSSTGALQVRLEPSATATAPAAAPVPTAPTASPTLPKTLPEPEKQASAINTARPQIDEPEPSSIPHLDLPQLADTTYYDSLALDVQPEAVGAIEVPDPDAGSPNPRVGYVKLQLKLEADGRVSETKALESNLPPVYEALALDTFGKAKFTPGRRNGRAVRARIVIEVNFNTPQPNSR